MRRKTRARRSLFSCKSITISRDKTTVSLDRAAICSVVSNPFSLRRMRSYFTVILFAWLGINDSFHIPVRV